MKWRIAGRLTGIVAGESGEKGSLVLPGKGLQYIFIDIHPSIVMAAAIEHYSASWVVTDRTNPISKWLKEAKEFVTLVTENIRRGWI